MRVLTVANHIGSRGGLERTQLSTCRGIASRGHRIDLAYVSTGDFEDDWRKFAGRMVKIPPTLPRRRTPFSSSLQLALAARTGWRSGPDVVYAFRYWDIPYAVTVASLCRAVSVLHLCLPPPTRIPKWLREAMCRTDSTLSVSRDTAERWSDAGVPLRDVTIAPTPIDVEAYAPASDEARVKTRLEVGLSPDDFVVLYAGRISREKGVEVLVRAFAKLAKRAERCQLVVVGSPSFEADAADSQLYQKELAALSATASVTWLPGRGDVTPLIQAADVAVLPSLWPDPYPRSALEPVACGVPVVASRVGGIPEILTGSLSEFLVEPGDVDGLAERLGALHDWRKHDPELGARCRAVAETWPSLDDDIDTVERAMQAAISRRRKR